MVDHFRREDRQWRLIRQQQHATQRPAVIPAGYDLSVEGIECRRLSTKFLVAQSGKLAAGHEQERSALRVNAMANRSHPISDGIAVALPAPNVKLGDKC